MHLSYYHLSFFFDSDKPTTGITTERTRYIPATIKNNANFVTSILKHKVIHLYRAFTIIIANVAKTPVIASSNAIMLAQPTSFFFFPIMAINIPITKRTIIEITNHFIFYTLSFKIILVNFS